MIEGLEGFRLTSILYDFLMANISRFFCAAATAAIVEEDISLVGFSLGR